MSLRINTSLRRLHIIFIAARLSTKTDLTPSRHESTSLELEDIEEPLPIFWDKLQITTASTPYFQHPNQPTPFTHVPKLFGAAVPAGPESRAQPRVAGGARSLATAAPRAGSGPGRVRRRRHAGAGRSTGTCQRARAWRRRLLRVSRRIWR